MSHINTILGLYDFNDIQQHDLLAALDLANCRIENYPTAEETLIAFSDTLQTCFPRLQGMERQQISDKFIDPDLRLQLLPLLTSYTNEIITGNNTANKLLLGASETAFRERMNIVVDINNDNYHTKTIYPLGGERELWGDYEPMAVNLLASRIAEVQNRDFEESKIEVNTKFAEIFSKLAEMENDRISCSDKKISDEEISLEVRRARKESIEYFTSKGITWPTETDMMEEVIKEYKDKLSNIEIKPVINAGKKLSPTGELVRPNTVDTYKKMWDVYGNEITEFATKQQGGALVMAIVSNQPFARSQEQQAINYFNDKPIIVELVAGKANLEKINLSKLFRSFAETIYAGKEVVLAKL
ncbi:MAG: hypothetical protein N4A31_00700 [Rickettsiales bacterium]|jgi:hypothetical protein|nr:hypothetical protein [Rickettsiales bacterium]